jgi:hypothetical protein
MKKETAKEHRLTRAQIREIRNALNFMKGGY